MRRQHAVRQSEKEAMYLSMQGVAGLLIEQIDSQVQCIWIL